MTALKSINHERFCRALRRKILAGEAQGAARLAAYLETMYQGDNPQGIAVEANARRLSNRPEVKARLEELIREGESPISTGLAKGTSVDPRVLELIKQLPKTGSVWPAETRALWLGRLEGHFADIYCEVDGPNTALADASKGGVARETSAQK